MVDLAELRLKLTMAVLLAGTWVLAFLFPILIGESLPRPEAGLFWVFGGLLAYFLYTGVRAWRRGWRSRFILRLVVPLSLLTASSILEWAGVWHWMFTSLSG
jgi:hypothetical protein